MRHYQGRILLSAGDLNTFLGCRHASALARRALDGEDLRKGEADATMRLVQRRGIEHEARLLQAFRDRGLSVVEIADSRDLAGRVAATVEAMRAGADVVFQAALARGRWHGFADFLVRVNGVSDLGPWLYEVWDTKLASRAKASHSIQLALYADLVEAIQGVPPPALRVRLGNGADEVIRPGDVVHYARLAGRRLEDFMDLAARVTEGEPCAHCALCDWRSRCEEEWRAGDHLSLVAGLRGEQRRRLRAVGVDTVEALAALPEGYVVPGLAPATLTKLRAQALLQHRARTSGERTLEVLPPQEGRGFARLPPPDAGDVYFDMEGDPLFPDGGLEYLFGMVANGRFEAFWAHGHAEERRAFEAFMDRLGSQLAAHPGAHVYHYNHYEPTALRRLAMCHGTRERELDDMLRGRCFVDLYAVVREGVRIGEESYSLKYVERFFQEGRQGEVGTAADSIVAYEEYCETRNAAILADIERYNEDDCHSTAGLHAWLLGLRPEGVPFRATRAAEPNPERDVRMAEEEAERAALRATLLEGASDADISFRSLVAELCDFHRREQKPQWWAMYDRMERDEEELVKDAECLGGLRALGPSVPDGKSLRRAYSFPAQETKLRAGHRPTVAATGEAAGQIAELDEAAGRIVLRRGKGSGGLPDTLSLGSERPLRDDVIRAAMQRFAQSVARGDGHFAHVEGILRREPPCIAGHTEGAPVLRDGEAGSDGAVRATLGLQRSHLLIQGPPGTGKTWTAARMAVALMEVGRRVGVSALSHKAIANLLRGIEEAARERGFRFSGVKKASSGSPDQVYEGEFIRTVTDNAGVTGDFQLVAGTVFLLARPEQELTLDTLFVDEAGQVSLANLVAMGMSARNVVLVGDQQQLGQPVQGSHPEGTGVSVLEHLLPGAATVPPERGILLDTSLRMHPAVCGWVSEAAYDGRLRAHPDTGRQRLVLPETAPAPLAPYGLYVHLMEHAGRSQACPEEADEIAQLWAALVGQRWVGAAGTKRGIGPEDVLVVAPYNVQVNLLQRRLPAGARVGTVDRFQGQEAPVVLVSMTTSSGEEVPRGIEFLFSLNRLNVAVSRARCLAVVLASPRLLETPCATVEDLRLVNALCGARAWRNGNLLSPEQGAVPSWRGPRQKWHLADAAFPAETRG